MMVTITRLYDDYATVSQAVIDLEAAGMPSKDISLVASNSTNWYEKKTKKPKVDRDHDGVEGAEVGASIGAVLAGGAGLLVGLGIMAIPGLGPVVAAGWLVSAGVGAVAGGAAGGIIGALTQVGVSEEEAEVYVEGIRRGGMLLSARVTSEDRARYEAILDRSAVNISDRGEFYRSSGWERFDPEAAPYTAEQIRRERANIRDSGMGLP